MNWIVQKLKVIKNEVYSIKKERGNNMITYKEQVMSIVKITKMRLIDSHKPDLLSPLRDVIFIYLANGADMVFAGRAILNAILAEKNKGVDKND